MSVQAVADTGLLVAYLDPDDQHHAWAVEQFKRFPFFVTCEAVIAEACHLIGRGAGHPFDVLTLLAVGAVKVAYDLRGDEAHVEAPMKAYADQPMDFADACLVRMAELRSRCEVVTIDGDFHIYRQHGNQAIPVTTP